MAIRSVSYQRMLDAIKAREFPELENVSVVALLSDEAKMHVTKAVYAECVKVDKKKYSWCCHYDFMIIVYGPHVAALTVEQKRILIRHELMHIGIDQDGNEPRYYIVPHDIEDFRTIIDRYGLDWARGKEVERSESDTK